MNEKYVQALILGSIIGLAIVIDDIISPKNLINNGPISIGIIDEKSKNSDQLLKILESLGSDQMKKNSIIHGRWYKINKKVKKRIKAKYHKIKDWVMDPKGYFLIAIDRKKKILRVGYCTFKKLDNKTINDMIAIVSEKTAIEIVNTLIRNKYISSHQHAADMGIELCKAELALKYNLNYVQDKDLKIR